MEELEERFAKLVVLCIIIQAEQEEFEANSQILVEKMQTRDLSLIKAKDYLDYRSITASVKKHITEFREISEGIRSELYNFDGVAFPDRVEMRLKLEPIAEKTKNFLQSMSAAEICVTQFFKKLKDLRKLGLMHKDKQILSIIDPEIMELEF